MLMDTLGALLGFIAIMLLLSLVVTALSQVVQSWLRIRGRNLRRGLALLISRLRLADNLEEAQRIADKICHSPNLLGVPFGFFESPKSAVPREAGKMTRLLGPPLSHVERGELKEILLGNVTVPSSDGGEAATGLPDTHKGPQESGGLGRDEKEKLEEVDRLFPRMETSLSKRFAFIMRWISFAMALGVAFVFQVSAPRLLSDLSTSPELRARAVRVAEGLEETAPTSIEQLRRYEDISDVALQRLQERNPEQASVIEEASGIGKGKQAILEELSLVLEEEAPQERERLIREYSELLDGLHAEANLSAVEELERATGQLASLNISPWRKGPAFYVAPTGVRWGEGVQWGNVLGVVMTAGLLTLGAPFWFERLRDILRVREGLEGRERKRPETVLRIEAQRVEEES